MSSRHCTGKQGISESDTLLRDARCVRACMRPELVLLRALLLLCFFAEAALVRRTRVARPHFIVAGRAPVRAVNLRACNRAGYKTFMAAVDWSTVGPPNLGTYVLASLDAGARRRCTRCMRVGANRACWCRSTTTSSSSTGPRSRLSSACRASLLS